jgi:hypothetical protein
MARSANRRRVGPRRSSQPDRIPADQCSSAHRRLVHGLPVDETQAWRDTGAACRVGGRGNWWAERPPMRRIRRPGMRSVHGFQL